MIPDENKYQVLTEIVDRRTNKSNKIGFKYSDGHYSLYVDDEYIVCISAKNNPIDYLFDQDKEQLLFLMVVLEAEDQLYKGKGEGRLHDEIAKRIVLEASTLATKHRLMDVCEQNRIRTDVTIFSLHKSQLSKYYREYRKHHVFVRLGDGKTLSVFKSFSGESARAVAKATRETFRTNLVTVIPPINQGGR